VSAENLGQEHRPTHPETLPSNLPDLSQTEPNFGGHRGVNTSGGDRPDDPPRTPGNARPQPSATNTGRSSSSVEAFAAVQAHSFNSPRQLEDRLNTIARGLEQHRRGRTPTEQDVRIIALLLSCLSDDDPDLANQHIL